MDNVITVYIGLEFKSHKHWTDNKWKFVNGSGSEHINIW